MKDLDMFICTHKDFDDCPINKTYKICCGKDILNNTYPIEIIYEQENKYTPIRESLSNISRLYHIWKNYPLKKYVGFVQYLRHFDYDIVNYDLNIDDNTCIVPESWRLPIIQQYANSHNIKDYLLIRELVKYKFNWTEYDVQRTENKLYAHCIFIMTSKKFDEYCNFIFQILDSFIQINNFNTMEDINKKYDSSQNRVLIYLAERISNMFIQHNFTNIIEQHVLNNFNEHLNHPNPNFNLL